MLKKYKKAFKNVVTFIKPRVIAAVVLTAALAMSVSLFHGQINTFVINYSGESVTVKTLSANIRTALACAGIDEAEYKIDSAESVDGKTVVSLLRTFPVFITAGNDTLEIGACENQSVGELLSCAGFTVDEFDMVEPALESILYESATIDYVNIDYIKGSYTQAVPYGVETVYSNQLEQGKKTTTPGKDGLEQVNYTQKLVNGEVKETKVDGKVTLLAAQNAVNTVGTRPIAVTTSSTASTISVLAPDTPIELDASGNPVNYKKHITVQATAYTYTGHNCSTGVAPKPGYIAVNPKVIPYGTKMYIKSSDGRYVYGYAIAADTGGFIYSRPTNVDLFFPTVSSMNNFGRRNVEIYILG
ncbi:MAG: G5 domain-containing protein [Clostridia bacterium]|nr:G5 domain-containing protein [Clostridia bacterium]